MLSAFFPWSWQLLQVLHSIHCHHRALTRAVSSGENFRQEGCPLFPQSAQEMSSSGFLSRFCSLVPKQKLQMGMGSATGRSCS